MSPGIAVQRQQVIDPGIEILTGKPAGVEQPDGTYPEETINYRVDQKLKNLAEGLKKFGNGAVLEENQKTETKK